MFGIISIRGSNAGAIAAMLARKEEEWFEGDDADEDGIAMRHSTKRTIRQWTSFSKDEEKKRREVVFEENNITIPKVNRRPWEGDSWQGIYNIRIPNTKEEVNIHGEISNKTLGHGYYPDPHESYLQQYINNHIVEDREGNLWWREN